MASVSKFVMAEDQNVCTVKTLVADRPTMDKVISPSIIKHEFHITNDNIMCFTIQRDKSRKFQGATESNISQTLKMESSIKKEGKLGINVTSSPGSPSPDDLLVTIKHKTDEQKGELGTYQDQMDKIQPEKLEKKANKSQKSISNSKNREVYEKSNALCNKKESSDVKAESDRDVKDGFTIIKWQGSMYNKTDNCSDDNFLKPTTGVGNSNSENKDMDNGSTLTIVKHSSLKAKDAQIKDKSQKRILKSCILSEKQPVVVLKRLNMKGASYSCKDSETIGKGVCEKLSNKVDEETSDDLEEKFIETTEEGMFLRNDSDTELPSAEKSSSVNVESEGTGRDRIEFNLSQEMEEEIQSAIQTNVEAMVISNQTSNGEGFSYVYPFACGQCNYTAKLQHHLINHMKIHSSARPFVCDVCGKGFKHAHHLNGHKRTHSGERPYSCEDCGRGFTQISNLLRHQKTHQGLRESTPHKCLKCNTSFSTAYSLKRHSEVHDNLNEKVKIMKNYKGKKKKSTYNPRIDDKKRQFECDVCGRRFRRKEHVTRHMLTHTGESVVFSCEVCEKRCHSKQALEKHLKVHTGDDIEIESLSSSSDDESDPEEDIECS